MKRVEFGRKWTIETLEDYNKAVEILEENEFVAEMSDDSNWWNEEKREVNRQMISVYKQAKEKKII